MDLQHDYTDEKYSVVGGRFIINYIVFICASLIILPGLTICKSTATAAGIAVTKNTKPCDILGDVPAEIIYRRNENLKCKFEESKYHFI